MNSTAYEKPQPEAEEAQNSARETVNKPLDRHSTITRLAVLNTAVELLETHRKPIELSDVISLATQLEAWASGR